MTTGSRESTPPAFFDALYARNRDPWDFETSAYEREKYRETLAALPPRRFRSALEVGSSIGVFTRLLAERCDALLGIDAAEAALVEARRRCRDVPSVRFARALVPADWPAGRFDLIVLSEILYFLGAEDIAATARRAAASLAAGGSIVLVNYLGPTGTACDGETAARIFLDAIASEHRSLKAELQLRHPLYRLDLLSETGSPDGRTTTGREPLLRN